MKHPHLSCFYIYIYIYVYHPKKYAVVAVETNESNWEIAGDFYGIIQYEKNIYFLWGYKL